MVQEYNKVRLLTFNFNITQSTITLRITYNFPNAGKKREKKVSVANDVTDGKQEEQESEGTLSLSLSPFFPDCFLISMIFQNVINLTLCSSYYHDYNKITLHLM